MKKTFSALAKLCVGIIALAALLLAPVAVQADQQGYPMTLSSPTNMPPIVTTGVNSNGLSSYVPVSPGRGLGLQWRFNVSSGTTFGALQLAPSVDGTNASSEVWTWLQSANGTTDVVAKTNWARGSLDGISGIFILGMTNANAGTLTNKGVLVNKPNG